MKVLVTFILTSAFWLVAFMSGMISTPAADVEATPPTPIHDQREAQETGRKAAEDEAITIADSVEVGPSGLAVPVAGVGVDQLVDTFTQARAGGARRHDAIDIMAEHGTPVVAAAPGTLEKIYFSEGGGGKTLYVRSKDRKWLYYYAHLDTYAPGLMEGQKVVLGQPLGTVGSTGNASPDGPHLHFAINRMEPEEDWWEGRPINPYPLLAGKRSDR